MSHLGPPARWLHCPRKGALIEDLFVPFKVPLDERYDNDVPAACRFYPSMVVSSFRKSNDNAYWVHLVVDLTNSQRFYNSIELEDAGIKHVRVPCKGRDTCPTEQQVWQFKTVVNQFLKKQPLSKIGVHCTHGFNRTGFCIVAYLVEELGYELSCAMMKFAAARPPGIYKADYIAELIERFGDKKFDHLPTPSLPDWCLEEEAFHQVASAVSPLRSSNLKRPLENDLKFSKGENDFDDDSQVNNTSSCSTAKKPKLARAFHGRNSLRPSGGQFMPGVIGVTLVTNNDLQDTVRNKTCEMVGANHRTTFPGAQPVSMSVKNIGFLQTKKYKVSWKADGFRYMMAILGRGEVYMMDRDFNVFCVEGLDFPRRKNLKEHLKDTLLDGEMIIDEEPNGTKRARYLIYDIIRFENQEVGNAQFKMRLYCIEKEVIAPRHAKMMSGELRRDDEPFSLRLKPFWDVEISVLKRILEGEYKQFKVAHETDGLIFQPNDEGDKYEPGTCDYILKWKPPELNTIDFKLKITIKDELGCLREKIGELYVVGSDLPFGKIVVTKEVQKYDGKIVECSYNREKNAFIILRERVDKSQPNHISVAEKIAFSFFNPIDRQSLYKYVERCVMKVRPDRSLMPPPASSSSSNNAKHNSFKSDTKHL